MKEAFLKYSCPNSPSSAFTQISHSLLETRWGYMLEPKFTMATGTNLTTMDPFLRSKFLHLSHCRQNSSGVFSKLYLTIRQWQLYRFGGLALATTDYIMVYGPYYRLLLVVEKPRKLRELHLSYCLLGSITTGFCLFPNPFIHTYLGNIHGVSLPLRILG